MLVIISERLLPYKTLRTFPE